MFKVYLVLLFYLFHRNLWLSYYKDASNVVEKLNALFCDSNKNVASLKTYSDYSRSLLKKLNDYQSIFDYYLISSKNFTENPSKLFL